MEVCMTDYDDNNLSADRIHVKMLHENIVMIIKLRVCSSKSSAQLSRLLG